MVDFAVDLNEINVPRDALRVPFTVTGSLTNYLEWDVNPHLFQRNNDGVNERLYDVSIISTEAVSGFNRFLQVTDLDVPGVLFNDVPVLVQDVVRYTEPLNNTADIILQPRDNHNSDFHYDLIFNNSTAPGTVKADVYVFRLTEPPGIIQVDIAEAKLAAHVIPRSIGGKRYWDAFVLVKSADQ